MRFQRAVLLLVIPICLGMRASMAQEESPEIPATAHKLDRGDPDPALNRLSDDDYKVRKEAQDWLVEWGKGDLDYALEFMFQTYRKARDPERRLRSRQVLKRLVIIRQPFEGEGYLGIRMETESYPDRDGELQPAVLVTEVRKGTPAFDSGLQIGDLVIGVDAVSFDDLAPTSMLANYITSKNPGDEITLKVFRQGVILEKSARLRRRAKEIDQAFNRFPGENLEIPDQAELDEADFKEWLRKRVATEEAAALTP